MGKTIIIPTLPMFFLTIKKLKHIFAKNIDIMDETKTMIPKRIATKCNLSAKTEEFNDCFKKMVMAYSRLPFHLGDEAIPLNPKDITRERLSDYVEKMKNGLTDDQQNVWNKLLSDAIMQINVICQFFKKFPSAEFGVNESINIPKDKRIICVNKEEIINAAAEVDVPNDCLEYFDKIRKLASALDEMREYERTHELLARNIEEMIFYACNSDEYIDKYISGYFNK